LTPASRECLRCHGTGAVLVLDVSNPVCLLGEEWPMIESPCHGCGGTGKVPAADEGSEGPPAAELEHRR